MSINQGSTTESQSAPETAAGEAEVADQKSASAGEGQQDEIAEESEASEAKDGEPQAKDSDEDQADEQGEKEPKNKGVAKKIGKLTRKLSEREREIEYLRAQLFKEAPKQAEPIKQATPSNEGRPKAESFDDHEDYLEALVDWKADQKIKAEKQSAREQELKSEGKRQLEQYRAKALEFAKVTPDFEEVVSEVDDVRLSITVEKSILKHGPELAYELSKDREELERICAMPATDAAEAIGEIRARMKAQKAEPKPQLKTTQAPKPPTPIGSKATPLRKSIYDADLPFPEYVRLRRDSARKRG